MFNLDTCRMTRLHFAKSICLRPASSVMLCCRCPVPVGWIDVAVTFKAAQGGPTSVSTGRWKLKMD